MPIPRILLTMLFATSLLAGCGLKGGLYLPEKKSDESDKAARKETTDGEQGKGKTQPAAAPAQP